MAAPTWASGQVLTASDVNSWFVPLAAVKTADESVTSSTTMQNDDQLVLTVAANATYYWQMFLKYEGGTGGSSDLKWQFTSPAGATVNGTENYRNTSGVAVVWNSPQAGVPAIGTTGAANILGTSAYGSLITAGSAGSFQLQWAQNTSSGTATIIHSGSLLVAWRVA